jgi:hypothetical protein
MPGPGGPCLFPATTIARWPSSRIGAMIPPCSTADPRGKHQQLDRDMQRVCTGLLFGTALAVAGTAWAQPRRDTPGIDIVVNEKPGVRNMACLFNGKPCSPKVVRQLSAEASKRGVMIALAGSDGSLKCTTRERKECSGDAVEVLQAAAKIVSVRGIDDN